MTLNQDSLDRLNNAVSIIEKQFGKGAIMSLASHKNQSHVDVVSTGIKSLDEALGIDGIPLGRAIELFGPEASGKTTLAIHIAANAQKKGLLVAYIDVEHAFDPTYAKNLGVDIASLLISQPNSAEEALNIIHSLVSNCFVGLIVLDSVAALVPQIEADNEIGTQNIGIQARIIGQAIRKLTPILSSNKSAVLFINQVRDKIGSGYGGYGEVTPGGKALKYAASIRIDIRRSTSIKTTAGQDIGYKVRAKIVKNKFSPPFKTVEFDLFFGEGISQHSQTIDAAMKMGILTKRGSWIYFNDDRLCQGKEQLRKLMQSDENLIQEIGNAISAIENLV